MNPYEIITELEDENIKLKEKINQIENDDAYKRLSLFNSMINDFKKRDRKQKLQDTFIKKLVERKIPVSYARGRIIESEDQIPAMLSDAEKEYLASKSS